MVAQYIYSSSQEWDKAVRQSAAGTFQLLSGYMDYHRHRFHDASLLIANEKGRTRGVFPANYADDDTVVSHAGLTYGGLLADRKSHATDIFQMLNDLCAYYRANGLKRLIYKAIPAIYHEQPAEADIYWLHRNGAHLLYRALSSAVRLQDPLPFSALRRRGANKARRASIEVRQSDDLETFWTLLANVLDQRHHVSPVHTCDEIQTLYARFPKQITLYAAYLGAEMVGGTLIYADRGVAHAQYIAANEKGRDIRALDALFTTLIADYKACGFRWFDFGISTAHDGSHLNAGLLAQKEGFGARSVCYDTYVLTL